MQICPATSGKTKDMGRRAKKRAETPTLEPVREEVEEEIVDEKNGFFACYLLCSLCPRYKGHTYIGFTINPCRRIRQHNGEIRCGAWRTKCKRPWEMILCIFGFPSKVSALQFEWAWQNPKESLAVRKAATSFRSLSGIQNKIKLAYTMLTLPQWERLNLTVNFFSTKYLRHSACCPKLPKQMKVSVHSRDELPCYMGNNILDDDADGGGGESGGDDVDGDDRDKDELRSNMGIDISDDNDIDILTSMGTSVNHPFETSHQRRWESCNSLYGEGEADGFTLRRERMISHDYVKPSKATDEVNTMSRTQSSVVSHGDDVTRQEEDNLKQLHPLDATHITVSPMHSKEKLITSNNMLFPCSQELLDCESSVTLAQSKQLSTPRTVNHGVSCDTAPLSPERNVIDLSTPSRYIARSGKWRSPPCVEIIDLIDSPI